MTIKSVEQGREVVGYYQLTSLATAVACPGNGRIVQIQAEAQNLRYRLDGVDPTTTVGMVLAAGETHTIVLKDNTLGDIRIIESTAGGIANIHVYR